MTDLKLVKPGDGPQAKTHSLSIIAKGRIAVTVVVVGFLFFLVEAVLFLRWLVT